MNKKLKSHLDELKSSIDKMKQTRRVYQEQIKELDSIRADLENVWTSPSAKKFVDTIKFRKQLLKNNIEILNGIIEVAEGRYHTLSMFNWIIKD